MVRKTGLALLAACVLFSAQAGAAAPTENELLRQCFRTLSNAQLQIWRNISNATLQSCRLYQQYYDDNEGFWQAIDVLRVNTEASINGIEGNANVLFTQQNCADHNAAYSNVTFDRWGFIPENEFPFQYAYLCGFLYN